MENLNNRIPPSLIRRRNSLQNPVQWKICIWQHISYNSFVLVGHHTDQRVQLHWLNDMHQHPVTIGNKEEFYEEWWLENCCITRVFQLVPICCIHVVFSVNNINLPTIYLCYCVARKNRPNECNHLVWKRGGTISKSTSLECNFSVLMYLAL